MAFKKWGSNPLVSAIPFKTLRLNDLSVAAGLVCHRVPPYGTVPVRGGAGAEGGLGLAPEANPVELPAHKRTTKPSALLMRRSESFGR